MEAMGKQSPIIIVVEDPEVKKQLSQMNAAADLGVASCWVHRAKEEFESEEGRLRLQDLSLKRRRVRKRAASAALFFEVKEGGYLSVKGRGPKRFIRLRSLGDDQLFQNRLQDDMIGIVDRFEHGIRKEVLR